MLLKKCDTIKQPVQVNADLILSLFYSIHSKINVGSKAIFVRTAKRMLIKNKIKHIWISNTIDNLRDKQAKIQQETYFIFSNQQMTDMQNSDMFKPVFISDIKDYRISFLSEVDVNNDFSTATTTNLQSTSVQT